jgi:2-polyprenyl-3-methyl-5-hydroxy-6-metoxy-1,4-benzoquinol methylase
MNKTAKKIRIEEGIVIGTASDKYESNNFVARKLVQGFDNHIRKLIHQINPSTITEIGCGEGHVTSMLLESTLASIKAFDISQTIIDEACTNIPSTRVVFEESNIYALSAEKHCADLVVCCEVLEHLDDPQRGLDLIAELAKPYALLSVPREPIWCALNVLRGAYITEWGNTPGHLQHWSKTGFQRFVSSRFDILALASPLPWTIILAKAKART